LTTAVGRGRIHRDIEGLVMLETQLEDVLTLAEAASYLRVSEEELFRLAEQQDVPAQRIGGEWRFLKRALGHWLTYGPRFFREFRDFPPWLLDYPILEELLFILKKRQLQRSESDKPKRGSKEAVRANVGVFKEVGDLEEVLANLSAMRAAKSGDSGG
jgi:excisionase family DNA binding protein